MAVRFLYRLMLCTFSSITFCTGVPHTNASDLVNIQKINPHIRLDIRYATTNNFTKCSIYPAARCYLRNEAAQALNKVQQELEAMGLGLLVFDGYRPLSVQKKFWALVPDSRYVANPEKGSRHNRGCAVDCTLVTKDGTLLAMPTDFDDFSPKAHRNYIELPQKIIDNRALLERIMKKHGFTPLSTEWWHFDFGNWRTYALLDKKFDEIE